MKLNKNFVAVFSVIILFLTVFVSDGLGLWQTESTKVPAKFTDGEKSGEYNPDDIRGSYTFENISSYFDVPVDQLAEAFGVALDGNQKNFQCKMLEGIYVDAKENGKEIGTGSVKSFVSLYLGLPTELNDVYFPQTAVGILENRGILSNEQKEYVNSHIAETVKSFAPKEKPSQGGEKGKDK